MLINVSPQTNMQYVLVHGLIKQMNVICTIALRFVLGLCVSYILSLPQVFLSQKLSNFAKLQFLGNTIDQTPNIQEQNVCFLE